MPSASIALQRGLWAALVGNAELMQLVTGVYDDVPPGATLPYVTIGNDIVTDWSAVGVSGREHRLSVTVWERAFSAGNCRLISSYVENAVLGMSRDLEGHHLASLRFLRSFITKDPDGTTRGALEFVARTTAT
jgi:hypothetical protein